MRIERIKEKILVIFGGVAGLFGFIGAMGWCCIPLVVSFLALFGITSTMFLITYSWLFLFLSVLSLSSVIILYFKKHGNPQYGTLTCPNCGHEQKEKIPMDKCVISYRCNGCDKIIEKKKETCCIFCSYGNTSCPFKK